MRCLDLSRDTRFSHEFCAACEHPVFSCWFQWGTRASCVFRDTETHTLLRTGFGWQGSCGDSHVLFMSIFSMLGNLGRFPSHDRTESCAGTVGGQLGEVVGTPKCGRIGLPSQRATVKYWRLVGATQLGARSKG